MEFGVEEVKNKYVLNEYPLIKDDWLKEFNKSKTPMSIKEILMIAKKKKEQDREVSLKPIRMLKVDKKKTKEHDLLELNEFIEETVSGGGEIITFDGSELVDPFADFLTDTKELAKPFRKNT